jgi:hypothetical protein
MKMDGKRQTLYPRKNWSSLILYNCAHPASRHLTPDVVNRETGAYLHRFQWLADADIGVLPEAWNCLRDGVPNRLSAFPVSFTTPAEGLGSTNGARLITPFSGWRKRTGWTAKLRFLAAPAAKIASR